jgi:hypothetical protein
MMILMFITRVITEACIGQTMGVLMFLLYSVSPQHLLSVAEASNGVEKNRR